MGKTMPLYVFLLCVLLMPSSSLAMNDPVAGMRALQSTRLLDERREAVPFYRMLLSTPKRKVDDSYADQEVSLSGDLWRRVWEVQGKVDLSDLSAQLKAELARNGRVSERFGCHDLDCGSSHYWANQVFENGRLVGRDGEQLYQVYEVSAAGGPRELAVFYATHRGAKQTVAVLDILTTRDAVEVNRVDRTTLENLLVSSSGWLPGMVVRDGQLDSAASEVLISTLKGMADGVKQRLYLMVHCYESNEMAANQLCSDRLADQLRLATFDGTRQLNIVGQAALAQSPDSRLQPALRFVFWPGR